MLENLTTHVEKSKKMVIIYYEEVNSMNNTVCIRLKNIREDLKLSQEYVAQQLGINRASVSLIENGQRKLSAEELEKLANIYGVTMEFIMGERVVRENVVAFARTFNDLTPQDQAEILNLMEFKNKLRMAKHLNA